jgi:hypothetical protein
MAKQRPIITFGDLRDAYGTWQVDYNEYLHVYTAEQSPDGRTIRYLVAHSVAEMAGKLETAEREDRADA